MVFKTLLILRFDCFHVIAQSIHFEMKCQNKIDTETWCPANTCRPDAATFPTNRTKAPMPAFCDNRAACEKISFSQVRWVITWRVLSAAEQIKSQPLQMGFKGVYETPQQVNCWVLQETRFYPQYSCGPWYLHELWLQPVNNQWLKISYTKISISETGVHMKSSVKWGEILLIPPLKDE